MLKLLDQSEQKCYTYILGHPTLLTQHHLGL